MTETVVIFSGNVSVLLKNKQDKLYQTRQTCPSVLLHANLPSLHHLFDIIQGNLPLPNQFCKERHSENNNFYTENTKLLKH